MTSYTAAGNFYRMVRDFAQRQKPWAECILYRTLPDEKLDITLAARRVYGTPDEFLTIMAAAGMDSVEQEMPEQDLILPTARQLLELKALAGIATLSSERPEELAADPIKAR
jgi:hypothetical protein